MLKVTILGCGPSSGTPIIGCKCAVCTSDNIKNKRLRSSILIEINNKNILIDTSPDLRQQALNNSLDRLDAILFTHDHSDHAHGINDTKTFCYYAKKAIPTYSDKKTLDSLQNSFSYCFTPPHQKLGWHKPTLLPIEVKPLKPFTFADIEILPIIQDHGYTESLGFRIGDFAYCTDVKAFSQESFNALKGIKTWVVDCLRMEEVPTHSHFEQTINWSKELKVKNTILTHLSHEMDYEELTSICPKNVKVAYDGMVIEA